MAIKGTKNKQKRIKIHLYNKTPRITFRSKLKDCQTKFLSEHHGRSVEQLCSDFTDKLDQLTDQCIPHLTLNLNSLLVKHKNGNPSPWAVTGGN